MFIADIKMSCLILLSTVAITTLVVLLPFTDSAVFHWSVGQLSAVETMYGPTDVGIHNDVTDNIWPGGIIPYVIHSNLTAYEDKLFAAMADYEQNTCVRFRRKTDADKNFVLIADDRSGCGTWRGMANIGMQPLMLDARWCLDPYTIRHELGHVVGFGHTHQRRDRDKYINVFWDNIVDSDKPWFRIDQFGRNVVPYDTKSVMHYVSHASSKNGKNTMLTKSGEYIGYALTLSRLDIEGIRILYKCNECQSKCVRK